MKLETALESLSYLIKSQDKVENFSLRIRVGEETHAVVPLGGGVHTASSALTAIVTASNIADEVTEVFFRRFDS